MKAMMYKFVIAVVMVSIGMANLGSTIKGKSAMAFTITTAVYVSATNAPHKPRSVAESA